jgi:rRNA-processing protein FCF1
VLEGAAKAAEVPEHPHMRVVLAPADGDSAIVALVATLEGAVTVVTADRGLRARLGATRTVGPATLLARLASR